MAAFQARSAAFENSYFHTEQKLATARHMERMVSKGLLPASALAALDAVDTAPHITYPDGIPTTVKGRPQGEFVYNHVKSIFPVLKPSGVDKFKLGTQVSFGRARWTVDNASIFSVEDGKRLAQTPHKEPTAFERIRAAKLARATLESPTVQGYRLLPVFTPGRAMLWGTILAVWGTAGAVMTASRQLGIQGAEDAPGAIESLVRPWVGFAERMFAPLREQYALPESRGVDPPELAVRLRTAFRRSAPQ